MVATDGKTGRSKRFLCNIYKNVVSTQMLEVLLLGVRTVLRLERDSWSMANS